jgi:hypothetical protein
MKYHTKDWRGVFVDDPFCANTYYVQSTHTKASDNNSGRSAEQPKATVASALSAAEANDRIVVGAGHVETVSAAAGINFVATTHDNVQLIGMGNGGQRPQFQMGTAVAANCIVNAAGVTIQNCQFLAAYDAVTSLLSVGGDDTVLRNCFFGSTSDADYQPVTALTIGAGADDTLVDHCQIMLTEAGATAGIDIEGISRLVIQHCHLHVDAGVAAVYGSVACCEALIAHNYIASLQAAVEPCISMHANSTGRIAYNTLRVHQDAELGAIVAAAMDWYENYIVNNDGETGILVGTPSV